MTAFLPPISAMIFLTCCWPGAVCAAPSMMSRPTSLEPVNAIMATRGSRTRTEPTVEPGAWQK